jgi:penicillin-binding protein 1A
MDKEKLKQWLAMTKKVLEKQFSIIPRLLKWTWIAVLAILLCLPAYIFSVSIDLFGLFGGMPSTLALENPENDLSSELISADGVSLGRYFRYNRIQVGYEELSEDLVNTLLLSEDHRFYHHSGLDFPAYLRVMYGILTFQRQGGGSTITQQLAKNLFTQNEDLGLDGKIGRMGRVPKRLVDKTKEWIIAVNLEKNFTKEEIIAMYLNTAEFGSNSYGIKVAAETFFNKSPDSLNLQESAVLVGLLQATSLYNPYRNPNSSLLKRNEVLTKVYRHGYKIKTREELDSLKGLPIELDYNVANQNKGLATYFRTVTRSFLMDWCKENGYDLWESGLKIYTTIDSRVQQHAEDAVAEHMTALQKIFDTHWKGRNPWIDQNGREIPNYLNNKFKQTEHYRQLVAKFGANHDSIQIIAKTPRPMTIFTWNGEVDTLMSPMDSIRHFQGFLHTGVMAMEPQTGQIKAWVGGINHKYFKYDHVLQGKRQPGSTFKAFVYGAAIENGYNPCYKVPDNSPTFELPTPPYHWRPQNSDGTYGSGKEMTIRQAMAQSVNSITAFLLKEIGAENVVDYARRVGISSYLEAVPSLCLGVFDVSVYEITGAYSTFANQGIYTKPIFITRIEDKNGNVIENFVPQTKQAISENSAYLMVHMLKGGVEERGGTSLGLSSFLRSENEIGGKTGTSQNASDGWYMGITKDLVTGVWVGGDERSIHFRDWSMGQGGRTARPIWDKFMTKVYNDKSLEYTKGQFKRPAQGLNVRLDCEVYTLPDQGEDNRPADNNWDLDGIR